MGPRRCVSVSGLQEGDFIVCRVCLLRGEEETEEGVRVLPTDAVNAEAAVM